MAKRVFYVAIVADNAAFDRDYAPHEVWHILFKQREVLPDLFAPRAEPRVLYDVNGNRVGRMGVISGPRITKGLLKLAGTD